MMDLQTQSHAPVSLILPTFNERENIADTIRSVIEAIGDPVEVIVVDDDSPDDTWKVAAELKDPRVRVVHRGARGLASAINRGIIESTGEIVGWMDADLSMPAERLPEMIAQLDEYPVVIGSRYVEGGLDDRPDFRVLTSRLINGLASLILGGAIKDYDSGFIVIRREVLDQVTLLPIGYGAYFIDFVHSCRMKGIPILELPYTLVDRTRGESKSAPNLLQFAMNGFGYVITILYARLRRHS
jgi:dolichol-phosphate mannosyltransferase